MSNYVTEYVPDKWKNLRLEYTDEYIDNLKKQKIHEPKIMKKSVKSPHPVKSTNPVKLYHPIKHEKPVSVLKNKSDVNKESHKFCEGEQCINKNNNKCIIL